MLQIWSLLLISTKNLFVPTGFKSLNPKFNKNIREKSNYLCKLNLNPRYCESIIMMSLVGTLLGERGGEVGQWTKQEKRSEAFRAGHRTKA